MNFNALLGALPIIAKGMGGIFIVILVIYLVIVLLRKLLPVKKSDQ